MHKDINIFLSLYRQQTDFFHQWGKIIPMDRII